MLGNIFLYYLAAESIFIFWEIFCIEIVVSGVLEIGKKCFLKSWSAYLAVLLLGWNEAQLCPGYQALLHPLLRPFIPCCFSRTCIALGQWRLLGPRCSIIWGLYILKVYVVATVWTCQPSWCALVHCVVNLLRAAWFFL